MASIAVFSSISALKSALVLVNHPSLCECDWSVLLVLRFYRRVSKEKQQVLQLFSDLGEITPLLTPNSWLSEG